MTFTYDGPEDGPLFVFSHGAGAPLDSTFMQTIAQGLAKKGIRVARFNFPYMQQRVDNGTKRPPERAPKLIAQFEDLLQTLDKPAIIGGKSMGGRMATLVASEQLNVNKNIKAVACLGFPFHPIGKPDKLRTEHFNRIEQPILIIQGERDKLGSKQEVESYNLPKNIQWLWLSDGDHDFKPRIKSGHTHQQHLAQIINTLAEFIFSQSCNNN